MRLTTEIKVNLIAAYHFVMGGLFVLLAAAVVFLPVVVVLLEESDFLAGLPGWFLGTGLLVAGGTIALLGAVFLLLGWGLWQYKPWARTGAMVLAILSIPFVPIGTIAGGVILYVLLQDSVRAFFLLQPAQ
jgi:hypothetical protein